MFIKQISVFLENKRGSFRMLTELLGKNGIDLLAVSIADTKNFGIVRCVVRGTECDKALELLKGADYSTRVNNVICVAVPDRPCGLARCWRFWTTTTSSSSTPIPSCAAAKTTP